MTQTDASKLRKTSSARNGNSKHPASGSSRQHSADPNGSCPSSASSTSSSISVISSSVSSDRRSPSPTSNHETPSTSMLRSFINRLGILIPPLLLCLLASICLSRAGYSTPSFSNLLSSSSSNRNSTATLSADGAVNNLGFDSNKQQSSDQIHLLLGRSQSSIADSDQLIKPSIFIGILVRNKAHTLPYFLRGLELQNYTKDRIQLTFIEDNSIDDSIGVLRQWAASVQGHYRSVSIEQGPASDQLTTMWSDEHYRHVIGLRQHLLDRAREAWADFYFSIDSDIILTNPDTLSHLVSLSLDGPTRLPIVAPMINCTNSEYYSNFWGAIDEHGYYKRSPNYFALINAHQRGTFEVAVVHSVFLINLRLTATHALAYYPPPVNYTGPTDDIIIFVRSVQQANVSMHIDNTRLYGFFSSPVEENDVYALIDIQGKQKDASWLQSWLEREVELFVHLLLHASVELPDGQFLQPSDSLAQIASGRLPARSRHGFDKVYYINLDRRPDRRLTTEYALDQLGLDAEHISAVDGRSLSLEKVDELGVEQLKGYVDPYHKRALKFGEIGCFLSHYNLWKEMIDRQYDRILILEDDVRFAPGFSRNLAAALNEADQHRPDWDLLYIGRKRMSRNERRVPGTRLLAYPDYTYWTLGYALNARGARKLLAQKPLGKMVAVDEFLPIMFNRHPRQEWLEQFEPRNLVALSTEPLLVEPQRYVGEKFYVSDTEDSAVLGTF